MEIIIQVYGENVKILVEKWTVAMSSSQKKRKENKIINKYEKASASLVAKGAGKQDREQIFSFRGKNKNQNKVTKTKIILV